MNKLTIMRVNAFALIALLLTGCGLNSIKPDVKKQIKTTEVRLLIKQPKIYAVVEANAGRGGSMLGLMGAIANQGTKDLRKNRAEKAIKPVVKALKGYKVKSLAQRVYDQGLKKVVWMNPGKVKLVNQEVTQDERYEIIRKSKADAVLFVELEYRLNETFKSIEVTTNTTMYREDNKDPAAKPDVIYRNSHVYKWDLPNNADGVYDRDELGKKWSEKKAAVLREKIKQGLDAEVKQLVAGLQKS